MEQVSTTTTTSMHGTGSVPPGAHAASNLINAEGSPSASSEQSTNNSTVSSVNSQQQQQQQQQMAHPHSHHSSHHHHTDLSFEDFTAMSPFLDPAALHLANPYASTLASSAAGKTE